MTPTPSWWLAEGGDLRRRAHAVRTPEGAFVSRSYSSPFALVAWHSRPLGVDIERIGPVNAGFGASIATPGERRTLAGRLEDPELVTSLWSSKEALAKALGDALSYDPRRLESPSLWPDGGSDGWRVARLPAPSGYVAWVCWRE